MTEATREDVHTYRYRPSVRWQFGLSILALGAVLLVSLWSTALFPDDPPNRIVQVGGAILCGLGVVATWHLARLRLTLDATGLTSTGGLWTRHLPYRQITSVSSSSKGRNAWPLVIRTDDHTVRVAGTLEGIGDFAARLREGLERVGNEQAWDAEDAFQYEVTATLGERRMDRTAARWPFLVGVAVLGALASLPSGGLLSLSEPATADDLVLAGVVAVVFGSVAVVWALAAGAFGEQVLWTAAEADVDPSRREVPPRDRDLERRVDRRAAGAGLVLAALTLAGLHHQMSPSPSEPSSEPEAPAPVPPPAPPKQTSLHLEHPLAFRSLSIDDLTMHPSDAALLLWSEGRDERTIVELEMDPCLMFPEEAPRGEEAPDYLYRTWRGVTWAAWEGFDAELLSIDLTAPDSPLVSLGPTHLSDASTPQDVVDAIAAFPPGPKAPPPADVALDGITFLSLRDDVRDGAVRFTFEDGRLMHIENWCDNT